MEEALRKIIERAASPGNGSVKLREMIAWSDGRWSVNVERYTELSKMLRTLERLTAERAPQEEDGSLPMNADDARS